MTARRYFGDLKPVLQRVRLLYAAVPFFGVSTGALYPLIALDLEARGIDAAFIGLVTSAYYAGSFAGSALFGGVIRRVGFRDAFAATAALAAVATWMLPAFDSEEAWLALRFLGGFAVGAYYVVIESWINGLASKATRGRTFAMFEAIRLGATAAGPALLVIGATHQAFFLVGAAYAIAMVPAMFAATAEHKEQTVNWRDVACMFRCYPFALALMALGGVLTASFYGLGAVYADRIGFSRDQIAWFVAVVLIAPALTQFPVGAAADRFGRLTVATVCVAVAGLSAAALAMGAGIGVAMVCLLAGLVSGLSQPIYALGQGRVFDAIAKRELIAGATAGLVAYDIGAILGPAFVGRAVEAAGPSALYGIIAMILFVAALLAVLDARAPRRCCTG